MNAVKSRTLMGFRNALLGLAAGGAALAAAPLPQPQFGPIFDPSTQILVRPAPPCSRSKMRAVRARATRASEPTEGADFEFIDCSLTFDPTDVRPVTKRLVLKGAKASGVRVNCNGVTIDGGPGTPTYNPADPWNMVEIGPKRLDDTDVHWGRPQNISFRKCKIRGAVAVQAIDGVPATTPGYPTLVRDTSPRNIVFDDVTITGVKCNDSKAGEPQCSPLYLFSGVNGFQLLNSTINGTSGGTNIYLDDLSFRNTIRNNHIEANRQEGGKRREVLALDGSSENLIVNNRFSSLEDGGISLYHNCNEKDSPRFGSPTDNVIINNVFPYDKFNGDTPGILVGERHCSPNFVFLAQRNAVMQNQIFKLPVTNMIREGHAENTPNFIDHNETVKQEIGRAAGCFVSNGYPNFILDGQFTNAFHNANGDPTCTGLRSTCHDGTLSQTADTTCQASPVRQMDVDCTVTGTNGGCQKPVSVPAGTKIVGAKAACNLEQGAVSSADLDAVPANVMQVLRASDEASQGRCTVGNTSIGTSMAGIAGINGLTSVSVACREHDANGGDCSMKVRLYFR